MPTVHVTERALRDLDRIERYSSERWGEQTARRYLADLSGALQRLEESPGLLRKRQEFSPRLRFCRVREHVLVCDVLADRIYLLCIWHGSMDFAGRLDVLEPQFVREVEFFHARITDPRRSSPPPTGPS